MQDESIVNIVKMDTPSTFEDALSVSKMDMMKKSLFFPFILIADDDVLSRSAIVYMLNSMGLEKIYEAENGEEVFLNRLLSVFLIIITISN